MNSGPSLSGRLYACLSRGHKMQKIDFLLRNHGTKNWSIWIEPWIDEHSLPAASSLPVEGYTSNQTNLIGITLGDNLLQIWGYDYTLLPGINGEISGTLGPKAEVMTFQFVSRDGQEFIYSVEQMPKVLRTGNLLLDVRVSVLSQTPVITLYDNGLITLSGFRQLESVDAFKSKIPTFERVPLDDLAL